MKYCGVMAMYLVAEYQLLPSGRLHHFRKFFVPLPIKALNYKIAKG